MSHVTQMKVPPGRPLIRDLLALAAACRRIGTLQLRLPPGCFAERLADGSTRVVQDGTREPAPPLSFRTYYADHGRFVNDYQEAGVSARGLGAVAVVSLTDEASRAAYDRYKNRPYELGVVPDPDNPGSYTLQHDFFCGGFGLEDQVGPTSREGGRAVATAPTLLMHYQMSLVEQAAAEQGHEVRFVQLPDGSYEAEVATSQKEVPAWA